MSAVRKSRSPRLLSLAAARRALAAVALLGLVSAGGCASYIDKARTARSGGDYKKAESLYKESMTKDKDELDRELAREELVAMMVDRAQNIAKADPTKAEGIYRDAHELDPKDENAQDGLGRLLASLNRTDEAIMVLGGDGGGFQKCELCDRYLAVLLKKRARTYEDAKKHEAALADYRRAFQLLPDPSTAFAIARVHTATDNHAEAAKAIEEAVPLIKADDRQSQADFVKVREIAVMRATADGDMEIVDRYMGMFPPGSGGDPWYALQLRVARERWRMQDLDGVIARIEPLLGEAHQESLSQAIRAEMVDFLGKVEIQRGVGLLRDGKAAEADQSFARASELDPADETLKLLRALAFAGKGDLERARQIAAALPTSIEGHKEVEAILESLLVFDRLDVGDVSAAKEALARAQAAAPDQPEVHVAAAAILAISPVTGLKKKDIALLRKSGLANYSAGVFRYAEALSEIAWAREQSKTLGDTYRFRGPGSSERADTLERQIRESFPFAVKFNPEPTTILSLRTKGDTVEATVTGPGVDERVFVSNSGPDPLTFTDAGLITISYGRSKYALVAESYTAVQVELP